MTGLTFSLSPVHRWKSSRESWEPYFVSWSLLVIGLVILKKLRLLWFFLVFLLCQFFQDRAKYWTINSLIVPQYRNDSLAMGLGVFYKVQSPFFGQFFQKGTSIRYSREHFHPLLSIFFYFITANFIYIP